MVWPGFCPAGERSWRRKPTIQANEPFAMRQLMVAKGRSGTWLCENAPVEALTAGHVGEVGGLSQFPGV